MMLFVAGARLRHLVITGVVTLGGLAYLIFGESYRRARFFSFFDPWKDPCEQRLPVDPGADRAGVGRLVRAWGSGASRQKWAYLPNAHTDFIFAVLGEEMGLIGEFVVLIAFGVMIYAGIRIAVRRPGHVRPAAGRRYHVVDRTAGHREPGGGDRTAADHRRAAALRLVRRDGLDRHARRRRRAGVHRTQPEDPARRAAA